MLNQAGHKTEHYVVLDSLRGICAIMVALFHFRANSHIDDLVLVRNSWLFVDFFFVLSGFVIAENYRERIITGEVTLWRFIWLRFARLYPLHIFMLILFLITEYGIHIVYQSVGATSRVPFTGGRSIELIPENILLLQSLGLSGTPSWNVPAWSISAEFWTYILFALLLVAASTIRKAWFLLTLLVVPIVILFFHQGSIAMEFDGGVLRCLFGFGIGTALSQIRAPQRIKNESIAWIELPILLSTLGFICIAPQLGITLIAPILFAIVLVVFAQGSGMISHFLKHRFFLILGTLSYSIYMTHSYLHGRLKNAAILAEKATNQSYFLDQEARLFGSTLWAGDLFILAAFLLTIAVSYLTWRWIERPSQKFLSELIFVKRKKSNAR